MKCMLPMKQASAVLDNLPYSCHFTRILRDSSIEMRSKEKHSPLGLRWSRFAFLTIIKKKTLRSPSISCQRISSLSLISRFGHYYFLLAVLALHTVQYTRTRRYTALYTAVPNTVRTTYEATGTGP